MGEFKSFVLGKEPYPEWFKQLDNEKRVTYKTDSDGALLRVKIQNPVGAVRANVGETIVDTGESIIKLSKSIVNKYTK